MTEPGAMSSRSTFAVRLSMVAIAGWLLWGEWQALEEGVSTPLSVETRHFEFEYAVEIPAESGDAEAFTLFLPIASDQTGQRILDVKIDSEIAGRIETESVFGNRYWVARFPARRSEASSVVIRYDVERAVVQAGDEYGDPNVSRTFLRANERVVVGHPVLDPILAEIRAATPSADRETRARAIYDWIVDNVEYKLVGTGWGNGDTFWACNARYGNCTDFHSLFISLARTEGIPARFEMGFPVPLTRGAGEIKGYHCWVEFWLPEIGWIPIDASEAFKHPDQRELFYGTHPADRIQFSRGRDLRLGTAHLDRPLNYFVYPYAEVDGKERKISFGTRFTYRDVVGIGGRGVDGQVDGESAAAL